MVNQEKKKQGRAEVLVNTAATSLYMPPPGVKPPIQPCPGKHQSSQAQAEAHRLPIIVITDADDSSLTEFEMEVDPAPQPEPRLYTVVDRGKLHEPVATRFVRVDLPDRPPTILPSLDLGLLRHSLETPEKLPDMTLLQWLKSNEVLPIVKTWYDEAYQNVVTRGFMHQSFSLETYPWVNGRVQVIRSIIAKSYQSYSLPHISRLAFYARQLVKNNGVWFDDTFIKYELEDEDKHDLTICVLLLAWRDLETRGLDGFFGVLLQSPIASSTTPLYRKILDSWYIIDESRLSKRSAATGPASSAFAVSADDRSRYIEDARSMKKRITELEEDVALAQKHAGEADEKLQASLITIDNLRTELKEHELRISDLLQRLHKMAE